ncbi:hypothetical protein, partial [Ellagibacter isourolithinifaciens]|uniref:hypothetical protein n=1 Tax=Ellagibacter isourolithinifaciens TaxID=2137581 RepID=UPI003AF0C31C
RYALQPYPYDSGKEFCHDMFSLHQVQQMSEIDSEDRYRLLAMRCRHAARHSLLSEVRLHQEKVYQGFCPESRLAGNGRI